MNDEMKESIRELFVQAVTPMFDTIQEQITDLAADIVSLNETINDSREEMVQLSEDLSESLEAVKTTLESQDTKE